MIIIDACQIQKYTADPFLISPSALLHFGQKKQVSSNFILMTEESQAVLCTP